MKTHPLRSTLLAGCAVLALLAAAPQGAQADTATWNPSASERLVKLPPQMLKKAIDRDYKASALAAAIDDSSGKITAKGQTLADLKGAAEKAEGPLYTELQHQFLAEKQAYVQLMGERLEMRQKQAETRKKLYERLLDKARRSGGAADQVTADLLANQQAARERFKSSLDEVDTQIFGTEFASESRYGAEYAKNKTAMDSLIAAIAAHPMNQGPTLDGEAISREDYLRQLVADSEAEIALIAQEEQILGFMAKLVALDAIALAEGLDGNPDDGDSPDESAAPSLTAAVSLFVGN
ncbi:hypothetical protein JCM17960_00340 [Magnetospira thiophila]